VDPLADYPQLKRLQGRLTQDSSEEEFAQSLANLLDRVAVIHKND